MQWSSSPAPTVPRHSRRQRGPRPSCITEPAHPTSASRWRTEPLCIEAARPICPPRLPVSEHCTARHMHILPIRRLCAKSPLRDDAGGGIISNIGGRGAGPSGAGTGPGKAGRQEGGCIWRRLCACLLSAEAGIMAGTGLGGLVGPVLFAARLCASRCAACAGSLPYGRGRARPLSCASPLCAGHGTSPPAISNWRNLRSWGIIGAGARIRLNTLRGRAVASLSGHRKKVVENCPKVKTSPARWPTGCCNGRCALAAGRDRWLWLFSSMPLSVQIASRVSRRR